MSENAWIEHDGGDCPVPHEAQVEVRYRDGETEVLPRAVNAVSERFGDWWKHEGDTVWDDDANDYIQDHGADIIAYRLTGPSA